MLVGYLLKSCLPHAARGIAKPCALQSLILYCALCITEPYALRSLMHYEALCITKPCALRCLVHYEASFFTEACALLLLVLCGVLLRGFVNVAAAHGNNQIARAGNFFNCGYYAVKILYHCAMRQPGG